MFDYMRPKDAPVFSGFESEEVVYAKNQPEYIPLRTLVGDATIEIMGRVINRRPVLSRWTFTKEQREAIANGADVILELSTYGQPLQPIRMAVATEDVNPDWVRVCLLNKPAQQSVKEA